MISALDDAISRILDKLENYGLGGKTFIVFASDNGGATYTGATDNGVLKTGKFAQFEGGINIPMILSWKGIIPEGDIYPYPVSLMDVFTTSLKIAGCELPKDRIYDGINLIPKLQQPCEDSLQRPLFWRTDYNKAVRMGDWKLVWNERDNQVFLYNLVNDPGEHINLASQHTSIVESLKEKVREWESELREPMWPGVMEFKFDVDGEITWWAI
jgi:arylsulfatase A-like enzyme